MVWASYKVIGLIYAPAQRPIFLSGICREGVDLCCLNFTVTLLFFISFLRALCSAKGSQLSFHVYGLLLYHCLLEWIVFSCVFFTTVYLNGLSFLVFSLPLFTWMNCFVFLHFTYFPYLRDPTACRNLPLSLLFHPKKWKIGDIQFPNRLSCGIEVNFE